MQVLAILFTAELHRVNQPRNILKVSKLLLPCPQIFLSGPVDLWESF